MILNFATKLFGSSNDRTLKQLQKHVDPINALEPKYEALSDEELQAQTDVLRGRLSNGERLDDIMYDAFAVVREASKRVLGLRPYDVQLVGGIVLHQGRISEMKTGEGKTLVATLPTYLNAIEGKGVHVVTVNDYLAKRDSEWMSEIYNFLGLSCGVITADITEEERREAYACDVTYGTNNEFGFDYLRDNMKFSLDQMVQRDFNFAIVDEVDSILIDEARTPLIISGPSDSDVSLYPKADKIIPSLTEDDYEMDEKHKTIVLNEDGTVRVEELLVEHSLIEDGSSMYDFDNIGIVHHVNQALRAHKLFHAEKDYIVKDGKVILIDEFTGRMMDGRRLSEGLHQAIEAKEGVDIQTENQTLASITFQNYFRLYPKLAGMTGTALTEAGEFMEIYELGVVAIETNKPVQRLDHQDQIYRSLAEKEDALVKLIRECQERGQPALVGTVSIDKSEELSARLKKEKIKHNVLNARQHEREAFIVAQAGRPGAITIATNMAGRGTDIKLGGNLDMRIEEEIANDVTDAKRTKAIKNIEAEIETDKEKVKDAGGLYIIGTERHESRRIDNQLRGRSGRQGDAGASMFFLSVEDDLMRIFAGDKLEGLLNNTKIGLEEGEALEHPLISKMLERAQGKVEGMHFEVRKNLLKFDNVMNDQRKVIYAQRRELMEADDIGDVIKDMRHGVIEDTVIACIPPGAYAEKWDIEALDTELQRLLAMDLPIEDWAKEEGIADAEMLERILDASDKRMAEKVANCGPDLWRRMEKGIALQILDQQWKDHLLNLDHLRQGINLRAFGQRDPLNEYKAEAFGMFEQMLDQLNDSITMTLSFVEISIEDDAKRKLFIPGMGGPEDAQEQRLQETREDPALMGTGQTQAAESEQQSTESKTIQYPSPAAIDPNDPLTWGKVQRNALCPCGSGKKYKHCHGKIVAQAS
ncbi:MAG: preprotein translocase subunit SecA [Bdellovibrionales bacterium]